MIFLWDIKDKFFFYEFRDGERDIGKNCDRIRE